MDSYYSIKNWNQFQHYRDRCPPWIKLHTSLLNDRAFMALADASKCLLMLLWILGSEDEGKVTADHDDLCFRLRRNSVNLKPLLEKGFIVYHGPVQADASAVQADACLETETETEGETEREAEGVAPATPSPPKKRPRTKAPVRLNPPSKEEFVAYCREKGKAEVAEQAWDYYTAGDWKDARGNEVYNWKQKLHASFFRHGGGGLGAGARQQGGGVTADAGKYAHLD